MSKSLIRGDLNFLKFCRVDGSRYGHRLCISVAKNFLLIIIGFVSPLFSQFSFSHGDASVEEASSVEKRPRKLATFTSSILESSKNTVSA